MCSKNIQTNILNKREEIIRVQSEVQFSYPDLSYILLKFQKWRLANLGKLGLIKLNFTKPVMCFFRKWNT